MQFQPSRSRKCAPVIALAAVFVLQVSCQETTFRGSTNGNGSLDPSKAKSTQPGNEHDSQSKPQGTLPNGELPPGIGTTNPPTSGTGSVTNPSSGNSTGQTQPSTNPWAEIIRQIIEAANRQSGTGGTTGGNTIGGNTTGGNTTGGNTTGGNTTGGNTTGGNTTGGNTTGGNTTGGNQNPTPYPTKPPTTQPTPFEQYKPLKLQVIQQDYESWWKNCLAVAVFDSVGNLMDSQNVACNKDPAGQYKTVALHARPWPECNKIRTFVMTYKNQGDTCSKHQRDPGFVCMGPYGTTPDWIRSSTSGPDFYKFYDGRNVSNHDSRIDFNYNWKSIESAAAQFRNGGLNRWIVGFYEDQPTLSGAGVDFNDYIFDLRGEGVKFTVEGSGITCDSQ